jgi:Fe-S-cluster formation regulator IscX/YfhJ
VKQMDSEEGWVTLGEVGTQLANLVSDFDPRTYGCRKLSDLVRKTEAFDIEEQKGGAVRIRRKAAAKAPPSRPRTAAKAAT